MPTRDTGFQRRIYRGVVTRSIEQPGGNTVKLPTVYFGPYSARAAATKAAKAEARQAHKWAMSDADIVGLRTVTWHVESCVPAWEPDIR